MSMLVLINLQVLILFLGNSGQHAWPDFIPIVKCENVIWPTLPLQHYMRGTALPLQRPADAQ